MDTASHRNFMAGTWKEPNSPEQGSVVCTTAHPPSFFLILLSLHELQRRQGILQTAASCVWPAPFIPGQRKHPWKWTLCHKKAKLRLPRQIKVGALPDLRAGCCRAALSGFSRKCSCLLFCKVLSFGIVIFQLPKSFCFNFNLVSAWKLLMWDEKS